MGSVVAFVLFCGLLLVWQALLHGLAWGLGARIRVWEGLCCCLVILGLCSPWLGGRKLFIPLDETIARNVPGAVLPEDPDRHGGYNDVVLQLYPWEAEVRAAFRQGEPPFWSDLLDGGSSPWANPQAAVLAPTAILARLGPLDRFFLFHFALKALTAMTGTLVVGRRFGLRRLACWVAALSFALSGGIVAWALFSLGTVVAWTPWLAAAGIAVARRPRARTFVAASWVAAFLLLSGHPEAVIAAGLLTFVAALASLRSPDSRKRRALGIGALVASFLLGGALAAPVLIPQAVQVLHSLRASRAEDRTAMEPTPAAGGQAKLFLAALNPRTFGRAFHDPLKGPAPWPVMGSCYSGVVAVLGAPWALLIRRRRRLAAPLIALGGLFGVLAVGLPPLAQAATRLPYVNAIAFTRWLPAAGLCLILTGALGLEALLRGEVGRKLAAIALTILAALILSLAQPPHLFLVLGLALAALLLRFRAAHIVLVAAILLDLVPWALDYFPVGHREMLYPETPFVRALQERARSHPGSRVTASGYLIYPSLLPAYGLPEVRVNNPVGEADYLHVLDAALGFRPETLRYKGALKRAESPLLSFLGVSVLVSSDRAPKPKRWRRVDQGEFAPLRLYENPGPLPPWFLPVQVDAVPAEEQLAAVAALPDPRRVVLAAADAEGLEPSGRAWDPLLVRAAGERGRIRLSFPAAGRKLVASSIPYSSGWRAVSGVERLSTVRVNAAFLGIIVRDGVGSADLRFEPPGLRIGIVLCATALLLLAGIVISSWRGART